MCSQHIALSTFSLISLFLTAVYFSKGLYSLFVLKVPLNPNQSIILCTLAVICVVVITGGLSFIAAATRLIQEGLSTVAGQTPTVVALNFNKPAPLSVCPVTESTTSSAHSITSPRPGILRKRAHDATLVFLLFY